MKKILLVALLCSAVVGCKKQAEEPSTAVSPAPQETPAPVETPKT